MDFDRRQTVRQGFDMRECLGSFVLETPDEEFEVECVRDVSPTGIGLELPACLDTETRVRLVYEEAGVSAEVDGVVVWCDGIPDSPAVFRLGIRFDEDGAGEGSRLLVALHRYTGVDLAIGP